MEEKITNVLEEGWLNGRNSTPV